MNLGSIAHTPNALATGVHMGDARWQFTAIFNAEGFKARSFDLILWHRVPSCEELYQANWTLQHSRQAAPHVTLTEVR